MALVEQISVARLQQLIVRRANHHLNLKLRNSTFVEYPAQGARSKDVRSDFVNLFWSNGLCIEFGSRKLRSLRIYIGNYQFGSGLAQFAGQKISDMPASLYGHGLAGKVIASPAVVGCRLHGAKYATRRPWRGIARPILETSDIRGFLANVFHIGRARAYVLSGYISSAQAVDETPMGAEDLFPVTNSVVANDDGLSSTKWQLRKCVLICHAPGQP